MKNSLQFAEKTDAQDPLGKERDAFLIPQYAGKEAIYFLGNSLGLPLKHIPESLNHVVRQWGSRGVESFFEGEDPWWLLGEKLSEYTAAVVGSKASEVVCMNALTVNLHLLFATFYRPTVKRFKILCEEKAFPSDQYLMHSQLEWHGYTPERALIEVPRRGHHWETEDFIAAIEHNAATLALIFLGGVNYYNGQKLDMKRITAAAHKYDIAVGWDLAHAVGNIPLSLHDWGVDFAAWCNYKYLNGGPGAVGGAFVHKKHHNSNLFRLSGWWGHAKATRFEMPEQFKPERGAAGWELSTPAILASTPLLNALQQRVRIGLNPLLKKQIALTEYLDFVIRKSIINYPGVVEIITPEARGCQLTLLLHKKGRLLFEDIQRQGIMVDWREPDALRLAPVPLYNSFKDIYAFGVALRTALERNF